MAEGTEKKDTQLGLCVGKTIMAQYLSLQESIQYSDSDFFICHCTEHDKIHFGTTHPKKRQTQIKHWRTGAQVLQP